VEDYLGEYNKNGFSYGEKSLMTQRSAVLITIDCLRADHLSCYGYERKTSPFMDFLSAKGIKFENAFANGPFTTASFLSILASAYPLEFKNQLPLPPNAILISEVLQKKGIQTAAIHSNPYLSAFYGYNRGWHYFQDFLSNNLNRKLKRRGGLMRLIRNALPKKISELYGLTAVFLGFTKNYEDAEAITKCAFSWLNKHKDFPFFLWLHYMDLHEPYLIFDAKFERKYSKKISRLSQVKFLKDTAQKEVRPKGIRGITDIYDDKLSYVDHNIEKLFHYLNREGLTDHTLIILTSDHGQEFLDHGCLGHTARFYDEHLHIPLLLSGPDIKSQVNSSLVSLLDIAPTILNFYGIAAPKDYRGHNLLSTPTKRLIISEASHNEEGVYISGHKIFASKFRTYSIRTEKWKYIRGKKQCELYNLEKDPKETKNVIDEEEAKAKKFEAIIMEHILWEEELQKHRATTYEKERIRRKMKKLKSSDKI